MYGMQVRWVTRLSARSWRSVQVTTEVSDGGGASVWPYTSSQRDVSEDVDTLLRKSVSGQQILVVVYRDGKLTCSHWTWAAALL